MKLTCTVSRLANGKWLARHTGSSTGHVEVTAPTRDEALTNLNGQEGIDGWFKRVEKQGFKITKLV